MLNLVRSSSLALAPRALENRNLSRSPDILRALSGYNTSVSNGLDAKRKHEEAKRQAVIREENDGVAATRLDTLAAHKAFRSRYYGSKHTKIADERIGRLEADEEIATRRKYFSEQSLGQPLVPYVDEQQGKFGDARTGYIDSSGTTVIPHHYCSGEPFENGAATVSRGPAHPDPEFRNSLIDAAGNIVLGPAYKIERHGSYVFAQSHRLGNLYKAIPTVTSRRQIVNIGQWKSFQIPGEYGRVSLLRLTERPKWHPGGGLDMASIRTTSALLESKTLQPVIREGKYDRLELRSGGHGVAKNYQERRAGQAAFYGAVVDIHGRTALPGKKGYSVFVDRIPGNQTQLRARQEHTVKKYSGTCNAPPVLLPVIRPASGGAP